MSLPIAWVLQDKDVLIVGGGEVAETRVRKLVPNGARVVVVAPTATPHIRELATAGRLEWQPRAFAPSDITARPWTFVLTAIDDHATSAAIAAQCRGRGLPVNVADVIPLCDFYFGANFEQGPLKVFVSTGAGAPRLSRRILDELASHAAGRRYGDAVTKVAALRAELRRQLPEDDAETSKARMGMVRSLCDAYSFAELADLDDREARALVRGMVLGHRAREAAAAAPAPPQKRPRPDERAEHRKKAKAEAAQNAESGGARRPGENGAKEHEAAAEDRQRSRKSRRESARSAHSTSAKSPRSSGSSSSDEASSSEASSSETSSSEAPSSSNALGNSDSGSSDSGSSGSDSSDSESSGSDSSGDSSSSATSDEEEEPAEESSKARATGVARAHPPGAHAGAGARRKRPRMKRSVTECAEGAAQPPMPPFPFVPPAIEGRPVGR